MDDEWSNHEALTRGQCIFVLLLLVCVVVATVWAATSVAPLLRA